MKAVLAILLSQGLYWYGIMHGLPNIDGKNIEPAVCDYVDPSIGSEGEGRVFVGPSMPFGMVKPSPDCGMVHNSGWAPMPAAVDGFSQTHVSGTGGGPKYGNILVQPFCSGENLTSHPQFRTRESMGLGYYYTTYESGMEIMVSASEHASYYEVRYPQDSLRYLTVDAGWFLGDQSAPDLREQQQFVASEVEVRNDREISGFTRIRGGWNNGRAYTVYFYLIAEQPFAKVYEWEQQGKQGVNVCFSKTADPFLLFRVGISFVSERKAKANAMEQPDMISAYKACHKAWNTLLGRVEIDKDASYDEKKMFYTGLYHTMLEPVDRTGENPLWNDTVPYYDDFYAIWDTYRTSSPLITLVDPKRQTDIVRSLINIGQRDGYMPDARSGNCNGRTQGGSNAEIVLADACIKGLGRGDANGETATIDWQEGLKQMLKDATLPPGGNQEAEGRGGLTEYLQLGYVPYGIDRSGNRTVEYAFCDYAIAQVAASLGLTELEQKYKKQSGNWRNLWRSDYEHAGTRGFIMPRDASGQWLDTLVVGHSANLKPKFAYTPVTNESPWNQAWWGTVFYEATSWEYSLSVPHDVPGLIAQCGGEQLFEQRLDTFFDQGFYNVNNEPSFLTPCLYHWLGKPERTSDRVSDILDKHFNATSNGLPGNDDSGSMSSWLVFHMMGLYPNAGTDQYLLHTPRLKLVTLHLGNGRDFTIKASKLSDKNRYIVGAKLNGVDYPYNSLVHADLLKGGLLELQMGKEPKAWGREMKASTPVQMTNSQTQMHTFAMSEKLQLGREYRFDYDLRTQHRHFIFRFERKGETVILYWQLPRPNKVLQGQYNMCAESQQNATELCYEAPQDGNSYDVPTHQLFALLPSKAIQNLKKQGECQYNNARLVLVEETEQLLHLKDFSEGYDLWVNNDVQLPVIVKMKDNPVEIDWTIE